MLTRIPQGHHRVCSFAAKDGLQTRRTRSSRPSGRKSGNLEDEDFDGKITDDVDSWYGGDRNSQKWIEEKPFPVSCAGVAL